MELEFHDGSVDIFFSQVQEQNLGEGQDSDFEILFAHERDSFLRTNFLLYGTIGVDDSGRLDGGDVHRRLEGRGVETR